MELVLDRAPQLETEQIPLDRCLGRVLAADVSSPIDVPSFAKSSMDGYAVVSSEVAGASQSSPVVLTVVGVLSPGTVTDRPAGPGKCFEIGTGAAIPPGADCVVMVERTSRSGEAVSVFAGVKAGDNVVPSASDVERGDVVLKKGTHMGPRHIGVLAAVGQAYVSVAKRPVVALASCGPELVSVGDQLGPGMIYDINSSALKAALAEDGCSVVDLGVTGDDIDELNRAILAGAKQADMVIVSGGSSLGSSDLVTEVLTRSGRLLLHGVAVKPGKPLVIGEVEGKLFVGLPGNPLSALSSYYLFIQPVVRKALGTRPPGNRKVEAILAEDLSSVPDRFEFLPVRLEEGLDTVKAYPSRKGSSAISEMASSDGYVEIPTAIVALPRGMQVEVHLY